MSALATLALRWPPFRALANDVYERGGATFSALFNLAFNEARIKSDFVWRCEFGGRAFVLPVLSTSARSWNAARVWRWSGNRAIRSLYEDYLQARPAGVLFDVGANDGTHAYPFAVSGYRCVCFEPQSSCVEYVRLVCERNGFDQVTVEQTLVMAGTPRDVEFFVSRSSWYSSTSAALVARFEKPESIRVDTVSLDQYCLAHGILPTFVKIDVEGAELEVLRGARKLIHEALPDLFVEVSSDDNNKRHVWELLAAQDYRCFHVDHVVRERRAVNTLEAFLGAGASEPNADFLFLGRTDI
jgi:FkbM family methyltransferase